MTAAELWLRGRVDGVPPALFRSMLEALPPQDHAIPEALAGAAITLYAQVARGAGDRSDALPLLAADALFTHAFEAQAEVDPLGVDALVVRCERGLGEVVP